MKVTKHHNYSTVELNRRWILSNTINEMKWNITRNFPLISKPYKRSFIKTYKKIEDRKWMVTRKKVELPLSIAKLKHRKIEHHSQLFPLVFFYSFAVKFVLICLTREWRVHMFGIRNDRNKWKWEIKFKKPRFWMVIIVGVH
jgi:hypothetical protein